MTDEITVDDAIQALRFGATDLLVKPYSSEDIREKRRAWHRKRA